MKTIEKIIPHTRPLPRLLLSYLAGKRLAIFDIETTGLSPSVHHVALIGIILIRKDDLLCRQYLAESLSDEKAVLTAFSQNMADADLFFSYNGDSFDIPFLQKRCQQLCVDFTFTPDQSIDLYRILRRTYFKTLLPDLRQKTVEKLFAQDRNDQLSSAECATLYNHYLQNNDPDDARKILLHNYDDIRLLYEMLQVFAKIDVHALMFSRGFFLALPACVSPDSHVSVHITQIKMQHSILSFQAHGSALCVYRDVFLPHFRFTIDPVSGCFSASLPFHQERGLSYLDLKPLSLCESCHSLPGFYSGFLLLSENEKINHFTINTFIKEFFYKVADDYDIL